MSPVSGLCARHLGPARRHLKFSFCSCYETMFNCSQYCWIDWNSAVLCFKWLYNIGVWTFARFVRPLLATILCTWEIWSPHIQCIMYFPVGQKKKMAEKKSASPHRFLSWLMTRNWILFFLFWPNEVLFCCFDSGRNAIVIVLTSLIAWTLETQGLGDKITVTGEVKEGLPPFQPPDFSEPDLFSVGGHSISKLKNDCRCRAKTIHCLSPDARISSTYKYRGTRCYTGF